LHEIKALFVYENIKIKVVYLKKYIVYVYVGARGGAVVEALRYIPEGRGIDSRWRHWSFL
jgi:hypothetical protein